MDKIVNVFGDSHTYGDGLDDCSVEKEWQQHSTQSWPYHTFADHKINNYSYSGCSNDTICLKLARHTTTDCSVAIMFTYPERLHITRNGYNFVVSHNFSQSVADNGNENWIAKQIAEKDDEKNKKFFVENFDDNFLEIMYLKNILWCQYFCESKNLEYYFSMVTFRRKNKMKQSLEAYRDSLYHSINWDRLFLVENQYGFTDYGKHINAERGNDNMHFGADYHKTFGGMFLDWINNKKQV